MGAAVVFENLYQILCRNAQRQPQALALAFEERRYSYGAFHQRVKQVMAQLSGTWSLRKGDRIVLAWGNHPAFCEMFFAALGLGIEVVPFSTKLKQPEGENLISHIAPQAVFYNSNGQDWLSRVEGARCVSLSEWPALTLPTDEPIAAPALQREDTAVIMFTSGTTGAPKGALITHGNLLSAVQAYAEKFALTARDSTVLAVPIYHITGLSALLALFICQGGAIWLQHRFNAGQVIDTVRTENITFLHGSPTVFILLCQAIKNRAAQHENAQPEIFPSLRAIACGAGHLNEGLIKELKERFPHTAIHPVYGLTETTSPATIFSDDVWGSNKIGSSGKAIPGLHIAIRDNQHRDLDHGQIGHIWLKGPVVIRQYWKMAEKDAACFRDGWFYTGDLGYLDEDGYLFIKDRSKDIINRGGEKIYSIELENIISTYSGVKEVAVIPAPSPVYGEEPVAFIVPENQCSLISDEIIGWLKTKVARFKLPARIIFTRTLPRTHNGKISKRQLREKMSEYAPYFTGRNESEK
ncbi:acyl--CoA ligase [Affinibrenneria salicis]|uniref:Acyl--CoA ligase n=1 Tax=Affinibrenneria salicis TaxID=2590031 RepID=A0A5J5G385_9GAMM|nr:class I adenylate-forming enzyme family protein [Affinibrenneria salicis]KAA9001103.1 acyl--CoA ligase [Affinibrenneria salicis]